jgi:hypothetical protein
MGSQREIIRRGEFKFQYESGSTFQDWKFFEEVIWFIVLRKWCKTRWPNLFLRTLFGTHSIRQELISLLCQSTYIDLTREPKRPLSVPPPLPLGFSIASPAKRRKKLFRAQCKMELAERVWTSYMNKSRHSPQSGSLFHNYQLDQTIYNNIYAIHNNKFL